MAPVGEAFKSLSRACRILSVEQKPNLTKESWFVSDLFTDFSGDRVVIPSQPSKRRFMDNSI